ncbi:MAG TPA: SRPBCC family protein [Symbiobacteriaceae bacterium]|nr:SRPBCC family protein [Symbiobacteriaceae bacterium]
MKTLNVAWFPCHPHHAFELAVRIERWPELLPHYRWVRFHEGGSENGGLVEMAARRDFGHFAWPVWWVSRMTPDPARRTIRYTHVKGVTKGMEVLWALEPAGSGTRVAITHEWAGGPRLIGTLFVEAIADRTLRHLAQHAEGRGSRWSGAER